MFDVNQQLSRVRARVEAERAACEAAAAEEAGGAEVSPTGGDAGHEGYWERGAGGIHSYNYEYNPDGSYTGNWGA